jgi:pyrimidine-specific ribonucleoside hydrolase
MKVICDGDPGHDDMLAFLLAAKHLDLLGITTVSGNQSLEKVTKNALKIVELGGIASIPVAKGMARPLVNLPVYAAEIHGNSGLDGYEFPEPTTELAPRHAVDFIIDTVMANEDVTLIPTGPLTNIASALIKEPRITDRISGISLMGGSLTFGNSTPVAEFNIYVDPEAAATVFESGIPIKMFGLNVTRLAEATSTEIERIRSIGTKFAKVIADLLSFYSSNLQRIFGVRGASLHDPCAVAVLIDPSIFTMRPMHVGIELSGKLTRGMTVCDYRHMSLTSDKLAGEAAISIGEKPNAEVAVGIDVRKFFDLLIGTLADYGSP